MSKKKIIKRFQEIGIIYDEQVILRSGEISNSYCDIKKSFGYPDIISALADEIGALLPPNCTCVAASGYGGLPLASLIASRFDKKFTAVRDIPKKHGKGGIIDGYIPTNNDSVVIIDDVLTTGSSIKATLAGLKTTKTKIDSAIVVVERVKIELPIPYSYIFTVDEIKKIARVRDASKNKVKLTYRT